MLYFLELVGLYRTIVGLSRTCCTLELVGLIMYTVLVLLCLSLYSLKCSNYKCINKPSMVLPLLYGQINGCTHTQTVIKVQQAL